jgi:predicted Zn finger-like uncharacterized protein
MQALCSQCSTRIQVDDARVPSHPFKVRCPKCQTVLSLPGRAPDSGASAAPPQPPPAEAPPAEAPPAEAPPPSVPAPEPQPQQAAPSPPPAPAPIPDVPGPATLSRLEKASQGDNDAIIALSGPAAPALRQALVSLGYNVDSVENIEEGARLLEQGVYEVAVTTRTPVDPGKPESLAQRMLRLPADARRRVFVILVGEEFRSGEGTQAWAAQADLVINPNDAGRCESLIRATISERRRLYQPLNDARRKIERD